MHLGLGPAGANWWPRTLRRCEWQRNLRDTKKRGLPTNAKQDPKYALKTGELSVL